MSATRHETESMSERAGPVIDGERGFGNGLPLPAGPLLFAMPAMSDPLATVEAAAA